MAGVNRRQFLYAGVPVTLGLSNARFYRGLSDLHGFPSPAGSPGAASKDDSPSKNLIANGDFSRGTIGPLPENWSVVAGNPALKPSFKLVAGQDGKRELMAESNGRRECYGYLRHPVSMAGGKTYRMRARFRFSGLDDINRNLVHGVFAENFNNGIFQYRKEGEWIVGEGHFPGPPKDLDGEVRLYFRYSATGKVWWEQVSLEECAPIAPRPVKLAVSWGTGDLKYWERWLDAAGSRGADLALMPEMFNGIEDPMKAETEDGPSRRLMAEKACQWKMHVSGTTYVWRGDLVFNTAPLFDREGKLIGIYDKNMVYEPELDMGAAPGRGFPVFPTDLGKVGIMICYDSWFPKTAEILALKGAELILFPNAGYYAELMHARAADNCVFIAVSSLSNPAGVWDSAGHQAGEDRPDPTCAAPSAILSFQREEEVRLFLVTVDLAKKQSPAAWGGPMRSAPGGRRCRETCMDPLEADIAREARRWFEV
ncbi:MAG: carbon-nitrogen hydrolase family protein [Acidobacteriia bacterium]|nr:carbon-nitrogen hydrolase family protein [Terriglobia bacterium]